MRKEELSMDISDNILLTHVYLLMSTYSCFIKTLNEITSHASKDDSLTQVLIVLDFLEYTS